MQCFRWVEVSGQDTKLFHFIKFKLTYWTIKLLSTKYVYKQNLKIYALAKGFRRAAQRNWQIEEASEHA